MDADFSVELGPPTDDPTLELPWSSPDPHGPRYFDLKRQPELLELVDEATQYSELREFLKRVNSRGSALETAKCDVWGTDELAEAEEIYGAAWKQGSYVDLVFSAADARLCFARHEQLARSLANLLKRAPEIPAAAEFIIRRCYYLPQGPATGILSQSPAEGFYISFYAFGYGQDADEARRGWAIALDLVANAILQLSAAE